MEHEKTKKEAEKILREFSERLKDISGFEETYYVADEYNITLPDSEPSDDKERKKFRKRFLKNSPKIDDDGYVIAEVGGWIE